MFYSDNFLNMIKYDNYSFLEKMDLDSKHKLLTLYEICKLK